MPFTPFMTVKEIVKSWPSSVRLFEQYGIDYCCGGSKSLADACAAKNLDVQDLLAKLDTFADRARNSNTMPWESEPLSALTHYIVHTHHEFVRKEIPRLGALIEKVEARHGASHPELASIRCNFGNLAAEMLDHMLKEEQVLFPFIEHLETSQTASTLPATTTFGSVARPVECMMREHDRAGHIVHEIRQLTKDYKVPEGACPTYRAMLDALQEFEQDLHQHVHLENNILFPRAVELEATACALA